MSLRKNHSSFYCPKVLLFSHYYSVLMENMAEGMETIDEDAISFDGEFEGDNVDALISDDIINACLRQETREGYAKKIGHFYNWLMKHHAECYDFASNKCKFPIPTNVLKDFFGFVCLKRGRNGKAKRPHQYFTFSHVSGYRSAIKDLYKSSLWTSGLINRLQNKLVSGVNKNDKTGMTASGVPPHVILSNRVLLLEEEMRNNTAVMKESFSKLMSDLPNILVKEIFNHFEINGALPVTLSQVKELFSDAFSTYLNSLPSAKQPTAVTEVLTETPVASFQSYTWGGRIHPVPENFEMPHE